MLKQYLMPDRMFPSFADVTVDFLRAEGVTALVSDIDNTLAPYSVLDPTDEVLAWCKTLTDAGIRIAFVSNNDPERVKRFNAALGFPAYPKAGKPSTGALAAAAETFGVRRENLALLGDQLLTDALAAHRYGIRAYIVPPIEPRESLFFKFKRLLERPFLRAYEKKHQKHDF